MAQAETALGLGQIGQISIEVSDIDRSVVFYRDVLGLRFLFQFPNLAFFDCGGVRLMLTLPEGPTPTGNSVIYYKVDEIEQAAATLEARGAPVESKPHLIAKMADHDLWMAFFRDPDKNLFALMCEVRH